MSSRRAPRGDPGLFGGLIGAVTGGVKSLLTGGNPITGAVSGAVSGFRGQPKPAPVAMTQPARGSVGPGIRGTGQILPPLPIPGTGLQLQAPVSIQAPAKGTGTMANGTRLACPAGFHPNKSDYFLRDGTFVAEGTRCVKNRRRDPLNPRALRSAIGRIDAGKQWQSKLREIETGRHTKAGTRKTK